MLKKHLIPTLAILILAVFTIYYFAQKVPAAPPGSQYEPGETRDPSCAPGDANCSVAAPTTEPGGSHGAVQFNNIGAFDGDTGKFFIDLPTGNVGVGTAAPSAKLHIAGNMSSVVNSATVSSLIQINDTSSPGASYFSLSYSSIGLSSSDGGSNSSFLSLNPFGIDLSPTGPITLQSNVGIGTTSPGALLNIVAADDSPWAFSVRNNTFSPDELGAFRLFQSNAGTVTVKNNQNDFLSINSSGNVSSQTRWALSSSGIIDPNVRLVLTPEADTTAKYSLYTGSTDGSRTDLVVRGDGNVGIGTATPGAKLSVVGLLTTNPGTNAGMVCITIAGDLWIDGGPVFDCDDAT